MLGFVRVLSRLIRERYRTEILVFFEVYGGAY